MAPSGTLLNPIEAKQAMPSSELKRPDYAKSLEPSEESLGQGLRRYEHEVRPEFSARVNAAEGGLVCYGPRHFGKETLVRESARNGSVDLLIANVAGTGSEDNILRSARFRREGETRYSGTLGELETYLSKKRSDDRGAWVVVKGLEDVQEHQRRQMARWIWRQREHGAPLRFVYLVDGDETAAKNVANGVNSRDLWNSDQPDGTSGREYTDEIGFHPVAYKLLQDQIRDPMLRDEPKRVDAALAPLLRKLSFEVREDASAREALFLLDRAIGSPDELSSEKKSTLYKLGLLGKEKEDFRGAAFRRFSRDYRSYWGR